MKTLGPGGFVRRNTPANVLAATQVIHLIARTSVAELAEKGLFAESKIGTLWASFYNCQDFASEVATRMPQSFQRDGMVALGLVFGGLVFANQQQSRWKRRTQR